MFFYIAWGVIVGFCIGGIFELRRSQKMLDELDRSWMDFADRQFELIEKLKKKRERDTE